MNDHISHSPPRTTASLPRPYVLQVSRQRWPVPERLQHNIDGAFRNALMLQIYGDALPYLPFIDDALASDACYLAGQFTWAEAQLGVARAGMIAGAHGSPDRTDNRGLLFLSSATPHVPIAAEARWCTGTKGRFDPASLRVERFGHFAKDRASRELVESALRVLIGANALAACPVVVTSDVPLAPFETDAIARRFGPSVSGTYAMHELRMPEGL